MRAVVEKVSINIKVVSLNVEHNFLIPWDMNVGDATALILQTLLEEYPGVKQQATKGYMLMQLSTGKVLNPSCSFRQMGMIQGEKLLLI